MSSLDFELDSQMSTLESEWRQAYEFSAVARAECETLVEELEMTELAWKSARTRLARLESLRDALGEELAELDVKPEEFAGRHVRLGTMSAA